MKKINYNRPLLVSVVIISAFVAMLNQTILAVAQPAIMQSFKVSVSDVNWLSTGYSLIGGILIPISAWMADRFNTKKLVSISSLIFLSGTIVSLLSGSFLILLTGRLIQAIGAGILSGLSMTILFSVFDKSESGKPTMALGIVFGLSPAIGPTLGGYIVDHLGWHWIFGITAPIIAIALVMSLLFMADVVPHKNTKLDKISVLLSTLGFGMLLYGVSEVSNKGWSNITTLAEIVVGLLLIIGWSWRQLVIDDPMIELRIFTVKNFTIASIISTIAQISMVAVEFILPLYLQNVRDLSAMNSGLSLLPGAIAMFLLAPISGSMVEKNKGRQAIMFGITIMSVSTLMLSFISLTTPIWEVITLYALRNVGLAFAMMPAGTMAMNSLPKNLVAHGSAGNNGTRLIGAALGTATLVSIMQNVANSNAPASTEATTNVTKYALGMHQALIDGAQAALWVATGIGIVGIVLAFMLKNTVDNQTK